MEVHVFPEAMRGTGEGHRPFDLAPGSTMTNGAVAARVDGVDGSNLTVAYRRRPAGHRRRSEDPIVSFAPGARADLKAGAALVARGAQEDDGTIDAVRILVGKDGLVAAALTRAADRADCADLPEPASVLAAPSVLSFVAEAHDGHRPERDRIAIVRRRFPLHLRPDQADPLRRRGYPIQWFRSAMPSNTLACMNALAEDARKREALGPGVDFDDRDLRRDQPPRRRRRASSATRGARRTGAGRHRRRPVEPVSRARSTSPGSSAPRASRSASAASTSRAASPCCPRCRPN